jgi:hypothetical protein
LSSFSRRHRLTVWLAQLSDGKLVLALAALLFVLGGWPLLLVDVPPLQDLPNHLATAHIIAHLELYPQYVFNGFLRSNSLLTLWLHSFGAHGLLAAGRSFTAVVLALHAVALPLFVLHFAGRRALGTAMLFAWPLVHDFFIAMGMLNFAFAFALSLIVLVLLDRQRQKPSLRLGVVIALLSAVLWYAHPFPLAVLLGLVGLHAITRPTWNERAHSLASLVLPLVPVGLLSMLAAEQHLVKAERPAGMAAATFAYLPPWETAAHLWLDASGALTWLGCSTVVPAILLAVFAWRRRRLARPLLSPLALVALLVGYLALPSMLSNWCYFNSRLVPFLWAAALVRLPERAPRWLTATLVACALCFSAALGVDYLRLDHDRAAFTAGMNAVPERAALLPLLFKHEGTRGFTAGLTHAWAYYVLAKNTTAPLVFAVERSYPITYRTFPPAALIPPALDEFAEKHGTAAQVCKLSRPTQAERNGDATCTPEWRRQWTRFWQEAEPRFTHVLTWAMPAEARPLLPASYRSAFKNGALEIYERTGLGSATDGNAVLAIPTSN